MRIRRKKWAGEQLKKSDIYIPHPIEYFDCNKQMFEQGFELDLELGCGKGIFIAEYALLHKDRFFIAIDIKSDILAVACRNIYKRFQLQSDRPDNILLIPYDATHIEDLIPANTISEIFINFPNPWYKTKHQKRRLTHPRQLRQYYDMLKDDGLLHIKTDDIALYLDTLEYLSESNYTVLYSTDNYSGIADTETLHPMSEHEMSFRNSSLSICYIRATKNERH